MRHLIPLAVAAVLAGCPLDPDHPVDYSNRPDTEDVFSQAGCPLEPLDDDGVFFAGTCSPVMHPQDQPASQWEEYGLYEFDVEPVSLFGGTVYRVWYAAFGREFDRAIGVALLDDGVTPQRYLANPIFTPPAGQTMAQLACAAEDPLNGLFHLWFRTDAGDLLHSRTADLLTWEGGVTVDGLLSDELTEVYGCDAWFDGGRVHMLVGGLLGGTHAIGESWSDDGVTFEPVTTAFRADPESPWQGGGVGFPSRVAFGGTDYLFYVGAHDWTESLPRFPEPQSPAVGLAVREGDEGEFTQLLVNPVPVSDGASPGRVRAALAGEWAVLYLRDNYEGAIIDGYTPFGVGQMSVWMPGLEEAS